MSLIKARRNQSMQDLILTACGTLEAAVAFCLLNDVAISDTPVAGQAYEVPADAVTDKAVLKEMADKRIVPGTLGMEPPEPHSLSMRVLLQPRLNISVVEADEEEVGYELHPMHVRYTGTVDFINVNELEETWSQTPVWRRVLKADWDVTGDATSYEEGVLSDMWLPADKKLDLPITAEPDASDIAMVWCLEVANKSTVYKDVTGLAAVYAPFTIIYESIGSATGLRSLVGVTALSATPTAVTVEVVAGHRGASDIFAIAGRNVYSIEGDVWTEIGGESVEVELGVGIYSFGARTVYQSDGVGSVAGPVSRAGIVIEIY